MGDVLHFRRPLEPVAGVDTHIMCPTPTCGYTLAIANFRAMTATGQTNRCPRCRRHRLDHFRPCVVDVWPPPVLE